MRSAKQFLILLFVWGIAVFSSCESENGLEDIPMKTGVLIVNEGNFGMGNGSISFYDEKAMIVTNNVVKNANNGAEIGSLVQSIYQHDGIGYLLCNDADKIEFISLDNYTFLANPETDISVPRYMEVVGDKGYITCWGPYDANYALPDSYIAVMDLNKKAITDTLMCGSGPEGIIVVGNRLFIANSFENFVTVINLNDQSSSRIEFDAAPQHFVRDGTDNIWVSVSSGWLYPAEQAGLQSINASTLDKVHFIPVKDMKGPLAVNASADRIYLLTAESYPETGSNVYEFNTIDKVLGSDPLVTGDTFYGIGYNITTDILYISDNQGFSGNGKIMVYNTEGIMLDEQVTAIGPNSFAFK